MANATSTPVGRRSLHVTGIVQGVGFRPFVFALAARHGLAGFVLNDGEGVRIEVEGAVPALDAFARDLQREAPELARVDGVSARELTAFGETGFAIRASTRTRGQRRDPGRHRDVR